MSHVNANVLYNVTSGTPLMGQGVIATLNCDNFSAFSPRRAWIKTEYNPGDGTVLTYSTTAEPNDPDVVAGNAIQGWMIVQDDNTLIIDAVNAQAIIDACNACCGPGLATIAPFYTSGPPAYVYPVSAKYCITRSDDGSAYEHENLTEDYVAQTVGGARLHSNAAGVSKYEVEAFGKPVAIGSDAVATGACT